MLLVEMCHNVICPSGAPIRPVQLENIGESIYIIPGKLYTQKMEPVLEKDPVGSKVLEGNVFVSNSEIKTEKEQSDHKVSLKEKI